MAAPLTADRLPRDRLAPVYFLYGEEPLQLLECADAIRRRAYDDGIAERMVFDAEVGIDWSLVAAEANAMSLFASRRLFEIRLGEKKPDKGGVEVLENLVRRDGSEDVVLVTAAKLDGQTKKTRWVKLLEDNAVTVATRDLRGPALPEWLERRAARAGKRLSRAAAEIIADRVEGNMLAAAQEVEKLALLVTGELIDEDDVIDAVRDSARFDVFQLADAVVAADLPRALRIARGLREEGTEALLLNWALGRELRGLLGMSQARDRGASVDAVMEQYRVWQNRRPAIRRMLGRLSTDALSGLLKYANFIDTIVKGANPGDPWDEIEILVMRCAGVASAAGLQQKL